MNKKYIDNNKSVTMSHICHADHQNSCNNVTPLLQNVLDCEQKQPIIGQAYPIIGQCPKKVQWMSK